MKTKALILSALILVPSAGAAAAQAASTQDFRVQTGKALAAPAQDFRVSYANAAVSTTPTIFAKSNLPKALSDAELDEVTGENPFVAIGVVLVGRAAQAAAQAATPVVVNAVKVVVGGAAGSAAWDGIKTVYNNLTNP